ncbi:NDR1/HIN1-like protein 1 [Momordica charantia]|uniref:NDR1/HIN1-like protein 1 n=1 Tax=Momordica charantia TaxID=3673 RepID=A0A6J1BY75_MOMCH|nr:NDR1/HIN1-like protein 1 [Momordica charantia]
MSKECAHHSKKRSKLTRRIYAGILIFLFLVLLTILLVWAILQPTKPKFIIQDATVYVFNVTGANFLSSSIQVTVSAHNPNDKIGIYYDRLDVFAVYRNQQITLRTVIQPTYQGHNDVNVWSPFVVGNAVPIAPYNGAALYQDQAVGTLLLSIKLDGRVRFKVGAFVSGRYHLNVDCPATISFGNPAAGNGIIVGNNAVKYQLVQPCSVSV